MRSSLPSSQPKLELWEWSELEQNGWHCSKLCHLRVLGIWTNLPLPFFFDEGESIGVLCCVRIIPRLEQTFSCLRESYHSKIASPACSWGEECEWHYDVVSQTCYDKPKSLSNISLWMGRLVYSFLVNIVDLAFLKEVFDCQLFMQTSKSFR